MDRLLHPARVSLRPLERFADPRICQIDLDAPSYDTTGLPLHGENVPVDQMKSNRLMPFKDKAERKFISLIRRRTKTLIEMDASHFWASGYFALHFKLRSKSDRAKIKRIVQQALAECGGFQTLEEWLELRKGRKNNRVVGFSGTGSYIRCTSGSICNPAYL